MSGQQLEVNCYKILIIGNCILRRGFASIVRDIVACASIKEASSFDDAREQLKSEDFFAAFFHTDADDFTGSIDFQALRADHPRLILAVVSPTDNIGIILEYLAVGVNGYILALSSQSELEQAIGAVLGRAIYIPPSAVGTHGDRLEHHSAVPSLRRNFRSLTNRQMPCSHYF